MAKTIEVLEGIEDHDGQWLMSPEDENHQMWHPTRKDALADAAQYASELGEPVIIYADKA